ncbi:MAG: DUF3078 domain-containing protein [Gloeobacteraceae cyanobacterium ES-bin-316]|nr:DUF3078 domain-containing protein [Ferruginibacter sp.]
MKRLLALLFILCSLDNSFAQDPTVQKLKKESEKVINKDPTDTIPRKWKTGGGLSLTINQGALSNWSAGGEKFSFSLNAALNVFAFYKKDEHSWDNSLDFAYGVVNTTSLGARKSSDLIYVSSKYGYELKKNLNLSVLGNIRTQFADGYVYNKTAAGLDSGTLTSKSFQPAYVVLGLGLDFKPTDYLSVFVSPITGRWVIVPDNILARLYGVPDGKNALSEFGAFLSANIMKKIGDNMAVKSKLELFSNYLDDPQNIDIFWSTVYTAKISKFINFSFNFDLVYDNNTKNVDPTKGPAPQILQLMGIGFAYKFNNQKKP